MLNRILLALLLVATELLVCPSDAMQATLDVKLGFLVAHCQLKGRHFVPILDNALDSLNQNSSVRFKLKPVLAKLLASSSKEVEGTKETIELLASDKVDFLLVALDTCRLEWQLASAYNVALLSFNCNQAHQAAHLSSGHTAASTLIQTKPPPSKIVGQLELLVSQLLGANNRQSYPQRLVLLYFKGSRPCAAHQPDKDCRGRLAAESHQAKTNDHQYRLIGEQLEKKLRVLLAKQSAEFAGEQARRAGSSLSVLNWHSTYHYGRTSNSFRQLVRQILVRSYRRPLQGSSRHQCTVAQEAREEEEEEEKKDDDDGRELDEHSESEDSTRLSSPAIYIVLGHYEQHLGLMLALDELNLLQPAGDKQFISAHPANQSLVIGVDIEQYEEHDDPVRFLHNLVMDDQESRLGAEVSASRLDLYRHYLAVVPARLSWRATELLDRLRWHNNQPLLDQAACAHPASARHNQTLNAAVKLTGRLQPLVRLPVEAYYLYDALLLLHKYLQDCLLDRGLDLTKCREGNRTRAWFASRSYQSVVNQELATAFDHQARADGSFSLLGWRTQQGDDEPGLVPLGQFSNQRGQIQLELSVEPPLLDPLWQPLWCQLHGASNQSKCWLAEAKRTSTHISADATRWQDVSLLIGGLLTPTLILSLLIAAYRARSATKATSEPSNDSWFDQRDQDNFLAIVKHLVLSDERSVELGAGEPLELVDLHCFMFQFHSCRFVHWLSAMLKLKELMFQYQSKEAELAQSQQQACCWPTTGDLVRAPGARCPSGNFFRNKHEASGTLRLLLGKYKMINESLVRLSSLSHRNVSSLRAVQLAFSASQGRVARLLVERTDRGNLRQALHYLDDNLDPADKLSREFRFLMGKSCIRDILNGLDYLHNSSSIKFHGQLRATTCLLSIDWRLKLSGFHSGHMRRSLGDYEQKLSLLSEKEADCHLEELIYQPPEILENPNRPCGALCAEALKLADFYSFAFLLYELIYCREPWSSRISKPLASCSRLLVERVKVDPNFRPLVPDSPRSDFSRGAVTWTQAQLFESSSTRDADNAKTQTAANEPATQPKADSQLLSCLLALADHGLNNESLANLIRWCWSQEPCKRPQTLHQLRHRLNDQILSVSKPNVSDEKESNDKASDDSWSSAAPTFSTFPSSTSPEPTCCSLYSLTLDASLISTKHDSNVLIKLYTCFLEKESANRLRKLRAEQSKCLQLQNALIPGRLLTQDCSTNKPNQSDNVQSSAKLFSSTSCCLFKLTLTEELGDWRKSVESMREILAHIDDLTASYCTHIHAFDSQADSLLRWLVIAGGPLEEQADNSRSSSALYNPSQLLASFALQLIDLVNRVSRNFKWQVKCALHHGPVLGAIVHKSRSKHDLARYVLFGDTLKILDAIEQSCPNQRIQVSSQFHLQLLTRDERKLSLLKSDLSDGTSRRQGYVLIKREGRVAAKGIGDLETYWLLNGPKLSASQSLTLNGS